MSSYPQRFGPIPTVRFHHSLRRGLWVLGIPEHSPHVPVSHCSTWFVESVPNAASSIAKPTSQTLGQQANEAYPGAEPHIREELLHSIDRYVLTNLCAAVIHTSTTKIQSIGSI